MVKKTPKDAKKFGVYVCDEKGLALRCFNSNHAAYCWLDKHYPNLTQNEKSSRVWKFRSRNSVKQFFNKQMKLGLTDKHVIACLLWYDGTSKDSKNLNLKTGKLLDEI